MRQLTAALATVLATPLLVAAESRLVVAVRDTTRSFCCLEAANQKLTQLASNMAPCDRFVLIDVGPAFDPQHNVKVAAAMPCPLPEAGVASSFQERKAQARRRGSLLANLRVRRRVLSNILAVPVAQPSGGTELHAALQYAADLLRNDPAEKKLLLLITDLEQNSGGRKSSMPPEQAYALNAVRVAALFVPWGADWEGRRQAWEQWFRKRAGADGFEMLDPARARLYAFGDASTWAQGR